MLRGLLLALCLAAMPALPAAARTDAPPAATQEDRERLWSALGLGEALEIMRDEGRAMSRDIAMDYLADRADGSWTRTVARIYDPEAMSEVMRAAFFSDLDDADPQPMLSFFESRLGQRIVALEMTARRAFLDSGTEEAARDLVREGAVPEDRIALIDEFIAVNDLVAFNTSGSMNTNVAFLSGLSQAELFAMSEQEILDRVWSDAEGNRADTEEWLRAYLATAYRPLADDEIRAYIDFSRTEAGQRLNRALFAGFGEMYVQQYHALGMAVARQLTAKDI